MPLAERIKRAREERGWSQGELARRAGVRRATISDLETGKLEDTRVSTLRNIAKALRVSVDYLIDMEYDRRTPPGQPAVESNAALAVTPSLERVEANV
jgi:transcriptional regulator with XRE-family HTH domain